MKIGLVLVKLFKRIVCGVDQWVAMASELKGIE